jgi:hypothetical protein
VPGHHPLDVQRLTVPPCSACNDRLERIEKRYAQELIPVVLLTAPEVAGVPERLTRSFVGQAATSRLFSQFAGDS